MNFCSHKVYISRNKLAALKDEEAQPEPESALMLIEEEEQKSARSDNSEPARKMAVQRRQAYDSCEEVRSESMNEGFSSSEDEVPARQKRAARRMSRSPPPAKKN